MWIEQTHNIQIYQNDGIGGVTMTKTILKRELRSVKSELDWLLRREQQHNPDWRFHPAPYSKRRARLVKMYWALKAMI